MRIADDARKHGVSDADIWHAERVILRRVKADERFRLTIGAAHDGSPIEIGVLNPETDDPVIIHAMPLRDRWQWMLTGKPDRHKGK